VKSRAARMTISREAHGEYAACVGVTLCCLFWTLGTGVLLGLKSASPTLGVNAVPLQTLQPLHTLGVMCFLVAGVLTLFAIVMRRAEARCSVPPGWSAAAVGVFFFSSAIAILAGRGSGLEYTAWPLALTALPLAALASMGWDAWRNLARLTDRAPEGAWLLLVGLCLTPLGLIERLVGAGSRDASRSLMIEWHALDTVFAGFNTSLYGLGILLIARPGRGRPLRSPLLFGVAAFAMLSTFGHHHYTSAQPHTLKLIAFAASMLGMVSFVRHVRAFRRARPSSDAGTGAPLIRTGALWTLFAIGSGVLLAEPHVNLLLHGTHAIVAHSMGAVIGVNVALVLGGLLDVPRESAADSDDEQAAVRRLTRWFNIALALLVANLVAAGVAKGLMRLDGSHHDYQPVVRSLLAPLPLIGTALTVVVMRLTILIVRDRRAGVHASAAALPDAARAGERLDLAFAGRITMNDQFSKEEVQV